MKLVSPIKDVYINQYFGENKVDFYSKMGMKGHNGIDFKAKLGCPVMATHDGVVVFAGKDGDGGISVTLYTRISGKGYKTIYYHLSRLNCKVGANVVTGDVIGFAGNTGKYTTGTHLHFGLKKILNKKTFDYDNGYKGAIDPAPFFKKDWDKSNAYHRYDREQSWLAEFRMRFKNIWLHKKLKEINSIESVYNTEFINALVYGGWDFNTVINSAMYSTWAFIKKDDNKKGIEAFKR